MKSKYYSFAKDLFLFAISTFVPKAITFFLVPLYTNCMSTAEYGAVDMVATTISILVPLLTLDISDSVLRFTIENKENQAPYRFAAKLVHVATALVIGAALLNKLWGILDISNTLAILFVVQFYLTALYGINVSYVRATERVSLLAVTSIVNTITLVAFNILFLAKLGMGINGYLLSNVIALAVVNAIIIVSVDFFNIATRINGRNLNTAERRKMLFYSTPLIASNLAWWVNSASDRYFITWLIGLAENGVYSVAYKIPTILQLVQSVFSQAWLLSIYREYEKPDGKKFIARVYDLYNSGMCIACAGLIVLDIPLAHFLYAKDFFVAWKYVPILLISVVFIANAGFFETIITLQKKSNVVAGTAVVGAVVNLILNYILIRNMGAMGAAVATALGYAVMFALRAVYVNRIYPIEINWGKHYILWGLLGVQSVCMIRYQTYLISAVILAFMCLANLSMLKEMFVKALPLKK